MTIFVIFYRLFIVLFFISPPNESFFSAELNNLSNYFFILFHLIQSMREKKKGVSLAFSPLFFALYRFVYQYDRSFETVYMSFEETDTEESVNLLDEVSSLDDDFDAIYLESDNSNEKDTDDDIDLHTWNEIEPESDAAFLEDHELIEEVTSSSGDNTINPIDYCRHFIMDEIIDIIAP